MGIDNDEPVSTAKDSVSGGQSDAIFLLVANKETRDVDHIYKQKYNDTDRDI